MSIFPVFLLSNFIRKNKPDYPTKSHFMDTVTPPFVIQIQLVLSNDKAVLPLTMQGSIPLQPGSISDFLSRLQTAYQNQTDAMNFPVLAEQCFQQYGLTSRERQVILLLHKGHSHKEISSVLHIAVRTVGKHVQNIYEKLGVTSKYQVFQKLAMLQASV
jgi:DNA-binding NarL/FixJ family response regulator